MLEVLTAAVFVLIAAGTACVGLAAGRIRERLVRRLTQRPAKESPKLYPVPPVWHELVNRFGSILPASPKDQSRIKRRLTCAGYRHPSVSKYFQGIRVVSMVLFGILSVAVAGTTAGAVGNLLLSVGAGLALGYIAPSHILSMIIGRRQRAIGKGLPNALDLMVVCVESGLGIDQTMLQVAKELQSAHPEIADEFTVTNLEVRAGKRRAEALHNLALRTGVDDLRKLVAVLVQTDRFGTSIANTLRDYSDYLRVMARQRAEERASKLAVKLVFPIFFCVLPSLFVVTIGPAMTRMIRDLIPMIENM